MTSNVRSATARIVLLAVIIGGCRGVLGLDDLVADRDPTTDASSADSGANLIDGGPSSTLEGGSRCVSTCGTPGCGECPRARVRVTTGGDYSIDPFEVSALEYSRWLATRPETSNQAAQCTWNDTFQPGVLSPASAAFYASEKLSFDPVCNGWLDKQTASGNLEVPVICVDYCDAVAYCRWAKGRLCGQIGGGALSFTSDPAPARGEWFNACSLNGARTYPYGSTYQVGACSDDHSSTHPVGSFRSCTGGNGAFDMSGNVGEWDDTCSVFGNSPEAETCLVRGGSYFDDATRLTCTSFRLAARAVLDTSAGFRCCGD